VNQRGNIRVFACIVIFVVYFVPLPTFRSHWSLECGLLLAGIFLITSGRKWEFALFAAIVMYLAVSLRNAFIESDPMNKPMAAASFASTPFPKVLQSIAKQRTAYPNWRFAIYDSKLASKKISIKFPANGNLADALDVLQSMADCKYRWHWHKACGNEPTPICAEFQFWPANLPEPAEGFGYNTWITQYAIETFQDDAKD
jgi:hypothetical protein